MWTSNSWSDCGFKPVCRNGMMLSTSRYRKLVLLSGCVVANILVGLYAISTLLALLTGLRGNDADPLSDDARPQQSTAVVFNDAAVAPRSGGEDRTGHRWKHDEMVYGYVLEPPDAAEGRYCDGRTVLISVCSAVENIDRRKAIRSTWGDPELLAAVGAQLVFVVARTDPTRSPPGIERRVVAEHRRQGDVVQADFIDSYVNLTAKTVMALRWATRACPRVRYVMKSDDDVYVNVTALTLRLEQERATQISTFGVNEASANSFIIGQVVDSARPVRDRRSKWYTSTSIYPEAFYPPYTSGTGYVLGASVVHRLVALLDTKSGITRPFWLEDVFVTGMLAASLPDVRLVHDALFNFRPMQPVPWRRHRHQHGLVGGQTSNSQEDEACAYRDAITVHDLTPSELMSLWKRLRLIQPLASHCTERDLELEERDDDDEELYDDISAPQ